jgi:hypothetical protein
VSLFDRPIQYSVFCVRLLYSVICHRFRVFEGFGVRDFDQKWFRLLEARGRPEVTSHLIPRSVVCISGVCSLFHYLFPFKSYSTFLFWLEIAMMAEILKVLFRGIPDPLMNAHIKKTPKRHLVESNRIV